MAEPINIPITTDVSQLLAQLDQIKTAINQMSVNAEKAGQALNNSFGGKKLDATNAELTKTKGLIQDIEDNITDWEKKQKEATSTKDIEKYNRKIAEAKEHLKEYQTQGLPAVKKVNKEATLGQQAFSSLATAIGTAFSVRAVLNFAKESIKAYAAAQAAENNLLFALAQRRDVQERLLLQAQQIQETTIYNDEDIIQAQAFLAIQGRSEAQIKNTIEAAKGLATVQGTTLDEAARKLDMTLEGQTGRLGRLDSSIKKMSKTQLENGAVVDLFRKKYAGLAEEMGTTTAGKLAIMSNQFDELKEGIGKTLVQVFEMDDGTNLLTDSLSKTASTLKDDNIPAYERLLSVMNPMTLTSNMNTAAIGDAIDAYEKETKAIYDNIAAFAKANNIKSVSQALTFAQGKSFDELSKEIKKAGDAVKNKTTNDKESFSVLGKTNDQLEEIIASTEEYSKEEIKLAKKQLEINKANEKSFEEYTQSVKEMTLQLQQYRIDLMKDGTDKLIAEEQLRYDKELAMLKESAKDIKQYQTAVELQEKIHLKNIEDIRLKAAQDEVDKIFEVMDKEMSDRKELEENAEKERLDLMNDWAEKALKARKDNDEEVRKQVALANGLSLEQFDAYAKKAENIRDKVTALPKNDISLANFLGIELDEEGIKKLELIKKASEKIFTELFDAYSSYIDDVVSLREKNVESIDNAIEKERDALNTELELREQGFASNVALRQKNLDDLEKQRQQALKQQEKALKQQRAIETVSQGISISTAIANILKDYTKIPFIGLVLGAAAITGLLALFKSSKKEAYQSSLFGEGGWIDGRPHSQGGTPITAEKDEFVVRKQVALKHDKVLEKLNAGNSFAALQELAKLNGISLDMNVRDDINSKEKYLSRQRLSLNEVPEIREIRDLIKHGGSEVTYGNGYRIVKFGNTTRKINDRN